MMTFDMNLALDTVDNLKLAIYEQHQIPICDQVLLISGGESLHPTDRVCKYSSAGTDTSPIFLFWKNQDDKLPVDVEDDRDEDMRDRVASCLHMEPNFNNIFSRTEMAFQLFESDKINYHTCDKLVHDQHLQQQGWASVVANLEDIVSSFKNKFKIFEQMYGDFLKNKPKFYEFLECFENDKQLLSRIPLLKSLCSENNPDLKSDSSEELALLDWINCGKEDALNDVYCFDELNHFDQEKLDDLRMNFNSTLKKCENDQNIVIKGLEDRLFALDKLMMEAKNIFDKQGILAKSFTQTQTRMMNINDPSILPDLCSNMQEQLDMMLTNHSSIIGIKNRCMKAKNELSNHLIIRLPWIVQVQEELVRNDEFLVINGHRLQRLCDHLSIVEQVNLTPKLYLNSVVEVIRRRKFSESFQKWSHSVSQMAREIIDTEIEKRHEFTSKLDRHFLRKFFSGMEDYPQNFTYETEPIDQALPPITMNDLDYLKLKLPDLSLLLEVPSPVPLPLTFNDQEMIHKSLMSESTTTATAAATTAVTDCGNRNDSIEHEITKSVSTASKIETQNYGMCTSLSINDIDHLQASNMSLNKDVEAKNQIIDDLVRRLEAAEERCRHKDKLIHEYTSLNLRVSTFLNTIRSQVFQEMKDNIIERSMDHSKCSKQLFTQLEQINENFQNDKQRFENKLTERNDYIEQIESDVSTLREQLYLKNVGLEQLSEQQKNEKALILSQLCEIEELKETVEKLNNERSQRNTAVFDLSERLNQLKLDLSQSKLDFIKMFERFSSAEIPSFADRFQANIEKIYKQNEENIKTIEKKLSEQKDLQVQRLREQMSSEHKNELEMLRHRFKFAISTTSIERTSSETSLEKVQLDIVDQSAQEKEIQRMKSTLAEQKAEHEQALAKTIADHSETINNLKQQIEQMKISNELETQTNDQLKHLEQYESIFTKYRSKYESSQTESNQDENILKELFEEIEEVNRSFDANSCTKSFISLPESSKPSTSKDFDTISSRLNKLKNINIITPNQDDKISITSCEFGDNVLVYYEKKVDNYIVFSLTGTLHYIHSDSLKDCDFAKEPPSSPNDFQWIIAKVTEKEYCQVKKEENRYKLPLNTKFYRIKIKPITKCNTTPIRPNDQSNNQLMNRSYMPSTESRTMLSNILSFFGSSTSSSSTSMSRSYTFSD